jgi:hypothetical protein
MWWKESFTNYMLVRDKWSHCLIYKHLYSSYSSSSSSWTQGIISYLLMYYFVNFLSFLLLLPQQAIEAMVTLMTIGIHCTTSCINTDDLAQTGDRQERSRAEMSQNRNSDKRQFSLTRSRIYLKLKYQQTIKE